MTISGRAERESRWNPPSDATFSNWVVWVEYRYLCQLWEETTAVRLEDPSCCTLFHTLFAFSNSITSRAFDWMDNSSNFLCVSLDHSLKDALHCFRHNLCRDWESQEQLKRPFRKALIFTFHFVITSSMMSICISSSFSAYWCPWWLVTNWSIIVIMVSRIIQNPV